MEIWDVSHIQTPNLCIRWIQLFFFFSPLYFFSLQPLAVFVLSNYSQLSIWGLDRMTLLSLWQVHQSPMPVSLAQLGTFVCQGGFSVVAGGEEGCVVESRLIDWPLVWGISGHQLREGLICPCSLLPLHLTWLVGEEWESDWCWLENVWQQAASLHVGVQPASILGHVDHSCSFVSSPHSLIWQLWSPPRHILFKAVCHKTEINFSLPFSKMLNWRHSLTNMASHSLSLCTWEFLPSDVALHCGLKSTSMRHPDDPVLTSFTPRSYVILYGKE